MLNMWVPMSRIISLYRPIQVNYVWKIFISGATALQAAKYNYIQAVF